MRSRADGERCLIDIRNRDVRKHLEALGAERYRLTPLQRFIDEDAMDERGQRREPRVHQGWPRIVCSRDVIELIDVLRVKNAKRTDILIAIHDERPPVVLIDDIEAEALNALCLVLKPRALVQTSPGSLQAWVAVPSGIDALQYSRGLARRFGTDAGAVGAHQPGKLAGFANRKPSRALSSGHGPWVELLEVDQNAGPPPPAVVAEIVDLGRLEKRPATSINSKSASARTGPDQSPSGRDFALVCRMLESGRPIADVEAALRRSANLRGKWEGYVQRTLAAARARVQGRRGG